MIIDPNELDIPSIVASQVKKVFTNLNEMYKIYIDKTLLPIAPSKIDVKIKNMNKTYDLVNGSQFNILKEEGLKTISFEAEIPNVKYPYAIYKNNIFKEAKNFIDEFKELKESKKPFMLKIIRGLPYDDNIKVSMEEFTIEENADNGRDLTVKFVFKEYKDLIVKEVIPISRNVSDKTSITDSNVNNVGESTFGTNDEKLAIVKTKRPISIAVDPTKKKLRKPAKNLVQTSRKHTGTPNKVEYIRKSTNITSNLENVPIGVW